MELNLNLSADRYRRFVYKYIFSRLDNGFAQKQLTFKSWKQSIKKDFWFSLKLTNLILVELL